MKLSTGFTAIIILLTLLLLSTDRSYSSCIADCVDNYEISEKGYYLGDYNISVLKSISAITLAQATIDMSDEDNVENPSDPDVGKGIETDVRDDIESDDTDNYKSILYEAARQIEPSDDLGAGSSAKDWHAIITIYLWLSGLNGNLTQGNTTTDLDVSFGDIWENFDVGGQLHIELWWKRWLFFIDPTYMKLSMNNSQTNVVGELRSDSEIKLFLFEFAGGYRVGEVPLSKNVKSNQIKAWPLMNIDLYAGGRLFSLDSRVNFTQDTPAGPVRRKLSTDETWFDFIVGTRFLFDLTENLLFTAKTDIGGFGLGFSSDISWNFVTNIGYQLPWWGVTPYVGYRVLYIDYKDGSGDNRFEYDVWQTGPQVGIGVRF